MKELLENKILPNCPRTGEIVEGRIINKGRSSVFLDLGAFGTAIIYGKEFQESKDKLKTLKIGDSVFVKITDLENEDGYVEVSLSGAGKELAWESLRQKKENNETIIVKILGANKGGLLAEVAGIPAFLPVSQLSLENYPKVENGDKAQILRELQKFVGKEMEVKIFDLDQKQEKLILSEKAKEADKIKELLNKHFKVGDVVEGEIAGIVDFGAFMKFNVPEEKRQVLEGLIHISELDWQLVENPADIVKTGEKVKAKIIGISDDKIFLSLKALREDPWKDIEKKYKKGGIVRGKATKINPFGAFVQIDEKIQGLCHVSEFGTKTKMESTLEVGKKYDFKILLIDPAEHKMSLKLVEKDE